MIAGLVKKFVGKIFNNLDPLNALKRWSRITKEWVCTRAELTEVFEQKKLIVTVKSYIKLRSMSCLNKCFYSFSAIFVDRWSPTGYFFTWSTCWAHKEPLRMPWTRKEAKKWWTNSQANQTLYPCCACAHGVISTHSSAKMGWKKANLVKAYTCTCMGRSLLVHLCSFNL